MENQSPAKDTCTALHTMSRFGEREWTRSGCGVGLDMIWNMRSGGRGGNTGWLGPFLNGAVETGDVKKVVDAPDLLS